MTQLNRMVLIFAFLTISCFARAERATKPSLSHLSEKRRAAFEHQIVKEFEEAMIGIGERPGDKLVTPLPLRGPVRRCDGNEIYILDGAEVRVKSADGTVGPDLLAAGSGGMPLSIYASKPGSPEFKKIFDQSVLNFYGTIKTNGRNQGCPEFSVEMHGSYLGRVGHQSGKMKITYDVRSKSYGNFPIKK
ncbi:MAG: hypothetical protein J0L82_18395 [Deltaproteobacteria bacterium]|nr:hypothetical protein [Deltaproteobacteria bacterium]